jgi:hypothetical protein
MKNPNDPMGNRTRELPAFSLVSQPSLQLTVVLHCMPFLHVSRDTMPTEHKLMIYYFPCF